MVKFNGAKDVLHISENQFNKLDELDGKKDGEISRDVFTLAKQIRSADKNKNSKTLGSALRHIIECILEKSITYWETTVNKNVKAIDKEVCTTNRVRQNNTQERITNNEQFKGIYEFGVKAIDYYLKYGTLNGFESIGLISGKFNIEDISIEFKYDDGKNDSQEIKNGVVINNKKADAIVLKIKTSNGSNVYESQIQRKLSYDVPILPQLEI